MQSVPIVPFEKFWEENKATIKEFALIFGNGLPKSSPSTDLKDKSCFDILDEEYKSIWHTVNSRVRSYISCNQPEKHICPEALLNHIRLVYGVEVFKKYMEKQEALSGSQIARPTTFLKKFKAIYTLNYDIFSYVSQFEAGSRKYDFADGFSNKPISLEEIQKRQEESQQEKGKSPFYYLHGAFHIFQKLCCKKYEKIVSNGEIDAFPRKIMDKYNEIDAKLYECQPGDKNALDGIDDPIIVFSGRSTYKGAAVSSDSYLSYCLQCLSKEKNIFTFGCSFGLDSHILDAIFKKTNGRRKKIKAYLGCYNEEDQETIRKYVKDNGIDIKNITIVNVSDEQFVQKIVWSQD